MPTTEKDVQRALKTDIQDARMASTALFTEIKRTAVTALRNTAIRVAMTYQWFGNTMTPFLSSIGCRLNSGRKNVCANGAS